MFDLIHEIAQSLGRNRTRTSLTGIAVAWGIFMLVVLLGVANGVVNSFMYNMTEANNMQVVNIWGGYTIYPYDGYEAGRRITLMSSDIDPLKRNSSRNIDDVIPTGSASDSLGIYTSREHINASVTGIYPAYSQIQRIDMTLGRNINQRDIDENRKVMVISSQYAKRLFGSDEKAIGSTVNFAGLSWKVVGIYSHRWRREVFVPYSTLKMLQGNSPEISQLIVMTKNMSDMEDAKRVNDGIIGTLSRLHHFDPREGEAGGIWMWNRFENYIRSLQVLDILNIGVWTIGLLTLLSGIVGISNIMFVSVKERTHEIGIRRAIGAKPRSILANVVCESIAITALFGYIGVAAGMGLVALIDKILGENDFMRDPGITLTMALEVTLLLVIAGAAAGLFPALKATKIRPVEALRDE